MRARIPRSRSGFNTIVPLGLIVRAFDAVRNRRQLDDARRATAGIGFPLDRRMRILVTTRRLLVWHQRGTRPPKRLGRAR